MFKSNPVLKGEEARRFKESMYNPQKESFEVEKRMRKNYDEMVSEIIIAGTWVENDNKS